MKFITVSQVTLSPPEILRDIQPLEGQRLHNNSRALAWLIDATYAVAPPPPELQLKPSAHRHCLGYSCCAMLINGLGRARPRPFQDNRHFTFRNTEAVDIAHTPRTSLWREKKSSTDKQRHTQTHIPSSLYVTTYCEL